MQNNPIQLKTDSNTVTRIKFEGHPNIHTQKFRLAKYKKQTLQQITDRIVTLFQQRKSSEISLCFIDGTLSFKEIKTYLQGVDHRRISEVIQALTAAQLLTEVRIAKKKAYVFGKGVKRPNIEVVEVKNFMQKIYEKQQEVEKLQEFCQAISDPQASKINFIEWCYYLLKWKEENPELFEKLRNLYVQHKFISGLV